jgi:gamma-glutamyl-gamma-aminobutyraldehyde dehydrogenase
VPETIHVLKWHAEAIDKLYDHTAPTGNALALVVREPIGVVGCVLPWNFPLLMLAWKIGPALAAGCSVVVKPAEQTSLTSLRVAELAFEAGVPAGVLNIVTGTGKEVGEPIGLHPDIDMVSFTGSTATGRRFLHYAAESNLKKVVLECGGKIRRWYLTMPTISPQWPDMCLMVRSGTWARTVRPPRACWCRKR